MTELMIGEREGDNLIGRTVELNTYGGFKIGYHKNNEQGVGSFIFMDSSGDVYVRERYYGDLVNGKPYVEEDTTYIC